MENLILILGDVDHMGNECRMEKALWVFSIIIGVAAFLIISISLLMGIVEIYLTSTISILLSMVGFYLGFRSIATDRRGKIGLFFSIIAFIISLVILLFLPLFVPT